MARLFTIGYSGHDIGSFVSLLNENAVDVVCDVRSTPFSAYKPDFSRGPLREHLNAAYVKYLFLGNELGARPADRTCYVDGQATYERIAQTQAFQDGLDRVRKGSESLNLALVCSEADPIECHRAILVCRHLDDIRDRIVHLHGDHHLEDQAAFDRRLVELQDLTPAPLLQQPGDWESAVATAYQKRGEAVAYRERGWPGVDL